MLIPYSSEDQLSYLEENSACSVIYRDTVQRLVSTVRCAWAAMERMEQEVEEKKKAYDAGLHAGLLMIKELSERMFNVKIPVTDHAKATAALDAALENKQRDDERTWEIVKSDLQKNRMSSRKLTK